MNDFANPMHPLNPANPVSPLYDDDDSTCQECGPPPRQPDKAHSDSDISVFPVVMCVLLVIALFVTVYFIVKGR